MHLWNVMLLTATSKSQGQGHMVLNSNIIWSAYQIMNSVSCVDEKLQARLKVCRMVRPKTICLQ